MIFYGHSNKKSIERTRKNLNKDNTHYIHERIDFDTGAHIHFTHTKQCCSLQKFPKTPTIQKAKPRQAKPNRKSCNAD